MNEDRITDVRIRGIRTLENVRLGLGGLTVLIGENGSGKSSFIEAFEILRMAPSHGFMNRISNVHGGLPNLLRHGSASVSLGLTVAGPRDSLEYTFSIARDAEETYIEEESLQQQNGDSSLTVISRNISDSRVIQRGGNSLDRTSHSRNTLIISRFGDDPPHPSINRIREALEGIDVHVPFDTMAYWATHDMGRQSPLRESAILERADSLTRFGNNLANVYQALKNRPVEHWKETLDYIRIGIGDDFEDLILDTDPAGSRHAIRLKFSNKGQHVPASALSDGTLAYLAFVAIARMGPRASLLAMDEPESHLHPQLLMRILDLLESLAEAYPVVIATHSDRLLDGLSDPAGSAVLCELDENRATRLMRPDRKALDKWLERYAGIGEIRSAGHEGSIMTRNEEP